MQHAQVNTRKHPESAPSVDGQTKSDVKRSRGRRVVIVDLSELGFMSSAGLHVLLRDRPEHVALVCPAGNIRRLLDIVRADGHDPIYIDLNTAIQSRIERTGCFR